jgi:hypothetical protein
MRIFAICFCLGLIFNFAVWADEISERAKELYISSIVLDTHADTTQRLLGRRHPEDAGRKHSSGDGTGRARQQGIAGAAIEIDLNGEYGQVKCFEQFLRRGCAFQPARCWRLH